MAVARAAAWDAREPTEPDGNIPPETGTERLLIVCVLSQLQGGYSVTSFTIGGQAYDYTVQSALDKTASNQDTQVTFFLWDEASIAAMSGDAVSYSGDVASTPNSLIFFTYATFTGVDQTTPYQSDAATSQSSDSEDLTTTSGTGDYIVVGVSRAIVGRDITDWDTLTEVFDAGGQGFRQALADGLGGDNTTTLTGDGTADDFNALALVINESSADDSVTLTGFGGLGQAGAVTGAGNSDVTQALTGAQGVGQAEPLLKSSYTIIPDAVEVAGEAGTATAETPEVLEEGLGSPPNKIIKTIGKSYTRKW